MKSIFLVKKGEASKAFETRETQKTSPKASEVGIKVECFGLNYADVMARNGLYKEAPPLPAVLGYEIVGVIDSVGSEEDKHLIGKRVVAFTRFGGYSQYVVTPVLAISEIGDLDSHKAICIATQFVTAYFMSAECVNLFPRDRVLIHAGAGGVGIALIQMCKNKGCEIFATAGSKEKLEFMSAQGVDHVINYREDDYSEKITELLKGEKLDVTFNPIAGSTFKKDLGLLGSGGRLVLFGGAERSGKKWGILSTLAFVKRMGLTVPIGLMMRSKSYIGVNMLKIGDNKPLTLKRCLLRVTEEVKKGNLVPHVGKEFKASEIGDAHAYLESRASIGKVVVYWE